MSDYSTRSEGIGSTGLVIVAVLIGAVVLVLALLGTGETSLSLDPPSNSVGTAASAMSLPAESGN